jgi:hydrogenase small subunit
VLGFTLLKAPGAQQTCAAAEAEKVAEIPVVWMANGSCSGCSVSLLNSASPSIQEVLLDQVIPGAHLSLGFHATVMAASGDLAMDALNKVVKANKGKYVLVVDGSTATKDDGLYCCIGEVDGKPITGYDHVRDLGRDAMAVLAVGACSAFGGIPAAKPNPTGAVSVSEIFKRESINTPVVNIPGCPPHPDWIVGTIATVLLGGLKALQLDKHGRPAPFFTPLIHDNCPYRGHFDESKFAEKFGEHGCLVKLGCKGPVTNADCPLRKFNNGTSWCVEAGHPCIGCCEPEFPYDESMFEPVDPVKLGMSFPGVYPAAVTEHQGPDKKTYAAVGLVGAAGFLAGVGVTAAAKKMKNEEPEKASD